MFYIFFQTNQFYETQSVDFLSTSPGFKVAGSLNNMITMHYGRGLMCPKLKLVYKDLYEAPNEKGRAFREISLPGFV